MDQNQVKKDHLTGLALRMKKGDRRAAAEVYDELMPKVYGFLFTRTSKKEIAEDLSQDVFLKLVEKVESYDPEKGTFVVWFWQMVRHMLIDYYREKKAIPFSAFDDTTIETMESEEMPDVDDHLQYGKVKAFLKTLPEEERELFEMRYVADMSYKEIAKVVGKSEGSLRVTSVRIKAKIKSHFKKNV